MIIAKGYDVVLELESGRRLEGTALLHDEDGKDWPQSSGLIASFTRTGVPLTDISANVKSYFGDEYTPKIGKIKLPPRSLSSWSLVGRGKRIDYTRVGQYANRWTHPFSERSFILWSVKLPLIYRRGRSIRIELGPHAKWNWRGIVTP